MKLRRLWYKAKNWLKDPALDILGAGVISTLVGRTWLYGAFAVGFASIGMYLHALTFAAVMSVDFAIHVQVLTQLRRLMGYDVLSAIAVPQLGPA